VITDRASGRSKGVGFVTFKKEDQKELDGLNTKYFDGWVIFVDLAKSRESNPSYPRKESFLLFIAIIIFLLHVWLCHTVV